MARRIMEQELYAKNGIEFKPMGDGKDLEVIREIGLHKTVGGVFSLQFNYNGEILAVGFGSGGIQLFNPHTGDMIRELRPCRQGGFAIMSLRFHPKNPTILYATTAEGHIYLYNVTRGEQVHKHEETGNEINSLDFCIDGYNYVTGGKDLALRVYESKTNQCVRTYEGLNSETVVMDQTKPYNTMRVFSIKFHPNNQYVFVSGGWDNQLKIWDIRDSDGIKRSIRGPHICGDSIDFKENAILTGQWAALHALQIYDYTSGRVIKEVKYPNTDGAFLYVAAYLNDKTVMAGGSGTSALDVIEMDTNRYIGQHKMGGAVQAADSTNDGRLIAVGGINKTFSILKLNEK